MSSAVKAAFFPKAQPSEMAQDPVETRQVFLHALTLSVLCVVSYWLITHMPAQVFSSSRDDVLVGGMWAVIAAIFVYRCSYEQSAGAAISRIRATSLSFVLCFIYLLVFPFHPWGLATLIGVGAVAVSLLRRPDDIITTGISTAIVMVVAAISPEHAWRQPILRVMDTVVGVSGAWIGLKSDHRGSMAA